MTPDQRLDYFRSEFEGKLSALQKGVEARLASVNEQVRQLEERLDKAVRELKNLEVSVR